jgi:hypothetical protein
MSKSLEQRVAELEALVEKISQVPKVKPYLQPGTWPRVVGFGEGLTEPVNHAALAVPKSKELIRAELVEADAKVAFDKAQDAWLRASQIEPGGQYLYADAQGTGTNVLVDVPADTLIQGRLDVPEYEAKAAAERALISARVRMFGLQKKREREMIEWEQRRNPSPNPSKDESQSWSRRIRMAPFGGGR